MISRLHERSSMGTLESLDATLNTDSSVNSLNSILLTQNRLLPKHSEISLTRDVTRKEKNRWAELKNPEQSIKEMPLFPRKYDNMSSNNNSRPTGSRDNLSSNSGSSGSSYSQPSVSFNPISNLARPGFSNIFGNSSSALDLSPFRGAPPVRFRMNPPKPGTRKSNFNVKHSATSASVRKADSSSEKLSVNSGHDDIDLYDDIADVEKPSEIFSSLEPPPEPPALLIGSDSSSDEENSLVIDDKTINVSNRSNIYDPTDPNDDSDIEGTQDNVIDNRPAYMQSPSYGGGVSEYGPHLPLPAPPALPLALRSVDDSESDDDTECPIMNLYSSTSLNLGGSSIQDIPIPESVCPPSNNSFLEDVAQDIPISESVCPPVVEVDDLLPSESDEPVPVPLTKMDTEQSTSTVELYSPSRNDDSNSDEEATVEKDEGHSDVEIISITEFPLRVDRRKRNSSSSEDESDEEKESAIPTCANKPENYEDESQDEETSFVACDNATKIDEEAVVGSDSEKPSHVDDDLLSEDGTIDNEEDLMNDELADLPSVADEDIADKVKNQEANEDANNISDLTNVNTTEPVASSLVLPSDDLDPVSDIGEDDFGDDPKHVHKDKRRKRKRTKRKAASSERSSKSEIELEEGEIKEQSSRNKKYSSKKSGESRKRSAGGQRRGREDKVSKNGDADVNWKKLSKNTKERNYRDGKPKPDKTAAERNKEKETTGGGKKKERRRELARYDVRKIISDRPKRSRDEFGRDISPARQRSISKSRSRSKTPKNRSRTHSPAVSKDGGSALHRPRHSSVSPDDRWIDWSPVRSEHRDRSRDRKSRSRSKNRTRSKANKPKTRHLPSRSRSRSRNRRDRSHERHHKTSSKNDKYKRRRSVSPSTHYHSPPPGKKRRRRSTDHVRRSVSFDAAHIRHGHHETPPQYLFERSWTRSPIIVSYSPKGGVGDPFLMAARYDRSPSIIDQSHLALLSPDPVILSPNQTENLTVIVPNLDAGKKKHKKKKKKKKQPQPSKEVFTSGDNIVVSVNFDDNQKTVSARTTKRVRNETESKKKKASNRKRRKQTLQVSEEVLNAKPVAVIDLNASPCAEMSPVEVINLDDSGDENGMKENTTNSAAECIRTVSISNNSGPKTPPEPPIKFTVTSTTLRPLQTNPIFQVEDIVQDEVSVHYKGPNTPPEPSNQNATMYDPFEPTKSRSPSPAPQSNNLSYKDRQEVSSDKHNTIDIFADDNEKTDDNCSVSKTQEDGKEATSSSNSADDQQPNKPSPAKEMGGSEMSTEPSQMNGGLNTLVLDLSSLGDDFVPKSSIPLIKTSQGKYEFQSGKAAPDKPITVVIAQQNTAKPQPQQVMVTPTRQVPTKPIEPIIKPMFPDILPWKLPPPLSQSNFVPTSNSISTVAPTSMTKSSHPIISHNGNQDLDTSFDLDDSPYSPATSEDDDLFEPPPLTASSNSPKNRLAASGRNYKNRMDALFSSSPAKKGHRSNHAKPVSAVKGSKKFKPNNKKDIGIKPDDDQLKILDDVPNSAVELAVKEKFLKKLQRQERVVEEVKVVLKPHYAKKHINKEEYKDILRKAVPKICHNKAGDINPSKIQSLIEAYVKKIRHSKKKGPSSNTGPGAGSVPLFPPMAATGMVNATKSIRKTKTPWG